MDALEASYRHCKAIASHSGSNFYRSFAILSGSRRQAMEALYAFARIIDDASDAMAPSSSSIESNRAWDAMQWHEWVRQFAQPNEAVPQIRELQEIRLALADATVRFAIPEQVFHDLIDGVDLDQRGQAGLLVIHLSGQMPGRAAGDLNLTAAGCNPRGRGAPSALPGYL